MRKKAITILLVAALVLSLAALAACGGTSPDTNQNATGGQQSQQQQGETGQQQQTTTTPAPTPTAEPTPDPEPEEIPLPANATEIITFGGMEWYVFSNIVGQGAAIAPTVGLGSDYRLIISRYILEPRILATEFIDDEETWPNNVWLESNLREYLNGEFLSNFTPDEFSRIAEIEMFDTADRIFLPNEHMRTSWRNREPFPPTTHDGQQISYWIQRGTPTVYQNDGDVNNFVTVEPNELHGVRPAMFIRWVD